MIWPPPGDFYSRAGAGLFPPAPGPAATGKIPSLPLLLAAYDSPRRRASTQPVPEGLKAVSRALERLGVRTVPEPGALGLRQTLGQLDLGAALFLECQGHGDPQSSQTHQDGNDFHVDLLGCDCLLKNTSEKLEKDLSKKCITAHQKSGGSAVIETRFGKQQSGWSRYQKIKIRQQGDWWGRPLPAWPAKFLFQPCPAQNLPIAPPAPLVRADWS